MPDTLELLERPTAARIDMIAGWRQWADAGSTSSSLPEYLIKQTSARRIGSIHPEGFYLFQIPGTHDLVRPVIEFDEGFPESLSTPSNEFYYTGDERHGTVIFLGDEPHLDIDRYIAALLEAAQTLGVKRIVSLGGVYGELPYNKERTISCVYSLPALKEELGELALQFSDYHGGAAIDSVLCRHAFMANVEHVGLYAFVPTFDFSQLGKAGHTIRLENDYMAWLGVMRRINYMLKTRFDLSDLEAKSAKLIEVVDARVDEIERNAPELNVREYFSQLAEDFTEMTFNPLGDVWEEELRRLFNDENEDDA